MVDALKIDTEKYDLLIEFIGWVREYAEDLGELEFDNNDEIVQQFITEEDDPDE